VEWYDRVLAKRDDVIPSFIDVDAIKAYADKSFELDQPEMTGAETAADIALGFTPYVGTAMGFRDFERARRDDDKLGMGLGILSMLPVVGGAVRAGRKGTNILKKYEKLSPPQTKEQVIANADPRFGDVVQTAVKGEVVENLPYRTFSEKGYLENPLLSQLRSGAVDDLISAKRETAIKRATRTPKIAEVNELREKGSRVTTPDDLFAQMATWEQLQGNPLVLLPADRTGVGVVNRIAGVDINDLPLQGGMQHAEHQGMWRSMDSAAMAKQAHINRVRDMTGKNPAAVYMAYKNDGSNFSTMPTEAILEYIEASGGLSPAVVNALDEGMSLPTETKRGITKPTAVAAAWPGYENPEQMMYWLTNPDALAGGPPLGDRRTAFVDTITKPKYNLGELPPAKDFYTAVNDPALVNLPHGSVGGRILIPKNIETKDLPYDPLGHRSYDTQIPAERILALPSDQWLPLNIAFRDMYNARKAANKNDAQTYRSITLSGAGPVEGSKEFAPDYQMIDQQFLDEAGAWYDKVLKK
jgi:hypothetical protein